MLRSRIQPQLHCPLHTESSTQDSPKDYNIKHEMPELPGERRGIVATDDCGGV